MRLLLVLRESVLLAAILGFAIAAPAAFAADAPAASNAAKAAPAPASAGSEPVARIDDTVITRNELEEAARNMFEIYKQRMAAAGQAPQGGDAYKEPSDEQKRKILESLVSSKILDMLIKKSDTKVSDAEVTERLKLIMESQGLKSEEEMAARLQKTGMTLDQVKSQVKDVIARQKYVEALTKDITATDAEIDAMYNKMKAEGQMELKEDAIDVATILVRVNSADDAAWTEAKKKIEAIRERIVKGKEDFSKIAKETSDDPEAKKNGGVYPIVTQKSGPFGPEFIAAAFALPDGEVSKPVKTKVGWCILKVVGKRGPGLLKLDDPGVRQVITPRVVAQKSKELVEKTVADARAKMKVEILLPAAAAGAATPPSPPATEAPKKDGAPNSLLVPGST